MFLEMATTIGAVCGASLAVLLYSLIDVPGVSPRDRRGIELAKPQLSMGIKRSSRYGTGHDRAIVLLTVGRETENSSARSLIE